MTELNPDDVKEDSDLYPAEKEINFRIAKDQTKIRVFSAVGGVTRRLIKHPEFEVTDYKRKDGHIVRVRGNLPVGCMSVVFEPRQNDQLARIISNKVNTEFSESSKRTDGQ